MQLAAWPQVLWTGPGDVAWARHTALTAEERSTVQLFKDNNPAVVYITNLRAGYVYFVRLCAWDDAFFIYQHPALDSHTVVSAN